jgi:hypothetical protein
MVAGDPSSPSSSDDDRHSLGPVRLHPRVLLLRKNPLPHLLIMDFELQVLKVKIYFSTRSPNVLHYSSIPLVYLDILMYSNPSPKLEAFPWLKLEIS